MKFKETYLKGAYIIELDKIEDDRGFFARSWCKKEMEENGLNANVVQTNVAYTKKRGTLRGIHYQVDPFQESKLIRCTKGAFYDVIIDLRKDSPTYLKYFGIELTDTNQTMLYVPEDFGHGYLALQDETMAAYFVSQFYTPGAESGIRWNDPLLNIEWPIEPTLISTKDQNHPDFVV